jgi:hypothetical protein
MPRRNFCLQLTCFALRARAETKFDFEKQLGKLTVRSKIPTVSWSRGLSWHVVDLREDFDVDLLRTFHQVC